MSENSRPTPVSQELNARPPHFYAQDLLFRLLLIVLLSVPVSTLIMCYRLYHKVPWGDGISLFYFNHFHDGLTLSNLFHFHNEHQIVLTKLLIYCDYAMLHGSNILPYVVTTLTLIAICGFYCWMLKTFGDCSSQRELIVSCGFITMLYLNGRMLWTITFPILFEHPSTGLFALFAFFAFSRLPFIVASPDDTAARPGMSRVSCALILAVAYVLAAMSSASGVLVGGSMLVVGGALLFRSGLFPTSVVMKTLTVVLIATALVSGVYIVAYHSSAAGASLQPKSLHPLVGFRFLILFVGGAFFRDSEWPISDHANLFAMYSVTVLFWSVLIWLAIQLFRRRDKLNSFALFHACVIVFVILTAAVGGIFRADMSPLEAINKKYAPNALLAWASAASLLIHFRPGSLFGKNVSSWIRPLVISSCSVLLLLPGDLMEFRVWRDWERQVKQTATAAASGVYSEILMKRFYADDSLAYTVVQQLIQDRAYCYRQMPPPGYPLRDRFSIIDNPPERLAAEIRYLEERPGMDGFTASGINANMDGATGSPSLVVTDSDNRVVGYGNVSDVAPGGVPAKGRAWFAAFRQGTSRSLSAFRVYMIDGTTARLAGELSVTTPHQSSPLQNAAAKLLPRIADHTDYSLELFNAESTPLIKPPVTVSFAEDISLTGWAVDRDAGAPVAGLEVVIDGKPYPCILGFDRPDVATFFKRSGFSAAGFSFKLPAAKIGVGNHQLHLRIYTDGGKTYLEGSKFKFSIE